jgi:DNA-binding CsgD family transcriptional regulator
VPDTIHLCIDALYAAALDGGAWPQALNRLATLFGADQAVIGPVARGLRGTFQTSHTGDDRAQVYRQQWADHDRLADLLALKPEPLFIETNVVPPNDFAAPFYTGYCARFGMGPRFGATIELLPGHVVALSLARSAQHAPPNARDLDLVAILRGHLERAAQLSRRAARRLDGTAPLEAVLERLDFAAALVNGAGQVTYANARLLTLRDAGLSVSRGQLKAENAEDQCALDLVVANALDSGCNSRSCSGPARLRRSSHARPLLVHALALPGQNAIDSLWGPADGRSALVMALDPARTRQAEHAPALRLLGLTRTEARIAALIADAESPDSIARLCDIEPSTVRVHLKHIYAKLDVRGQVELAVLLSRMGNPLGDAFEPQLPTIAAAPRHILRLYPN